MSGVEPPMHRFSTFLSTPFGDIVQTATGKWETALKDA
jgi:hypothetical protein